MKILFRSKVTPGTRVDDIVALRAAEAAAVWGIFKSGVMRELYFSPELPGVYGVVEADSVQAASLALQDLPMVKGGLIELEFFSLLPYDHLELLFADRHL